MNKSLILSIVLTLSFSAHAGGSEKLKSSLEKWLGNGFGQQLQVSVNKQKIQFEGCKQKAYELYVSKPFAENFSIVMSLAYGKGKTSWGVFSQTVIVKQYRIVPKWHFEGFSVGVGMSVQQAHRLRTSHGPDINLPLQKQWTVEADLPAFADNHTTRIAMVHEQWQAEDVGLSSSNYSAKNTGVNLSYSILF